MNYLCDMEIDVKQFKKNAIAHNLCAEFNGIWDGCHSKKQLMDMMLGAKGIDYTANAIAKKWGVSPSYIAENFSSFANGRYERNIGGYTSKFYCKYEGGVCADTTLVLLIDSKVKMEIPQHCICSVYCTGKCEIEVSGKGRCVFVCYGDPKNTKISGKCENMKRLNKKDCDRYE